MSVEIIRFDEQPMSTPLPWTESERDSWYFVNWETPTGRGGDFFKRTAHAAAIGRAVLADCRARNMEVASVSVWQYETHADLEPYVVTTADGTTDMVDLPRSNPLAIITDSAEPESTIQAVEKAMEEALIAQRASNAARSRLLEACKVAYDCDDASANSLARMVNGVVSRPTLLKTLSLSEQRAAAEEA